VVLPEGYLKAAYAVFRDHGALCIADEVRTVLQTACCAFRQLYWLRNCTHRGSLPAWRSEYADSSF
jgi:hypothetical protein